MKQVSGREIVRLLERTGWTLVRSNGRHHILTKAGLRERLSVPVHGSRSLKLGLLRAIMKIAGLTEADL